MLFGISVFPAVARTGWFTVMISATLVESPVLIMATTMIMLATVMLMMAMSMKSAWNYSDQLER